jgi:signal transduction histidine kinase
VLLGRATTPILRLAEAARRVGPGETHLPFDASGGEIERLRTELNEALARLEQGYRERQQFLSNVAHDIKTPISVMLTQSQVVQPEGSSLDDLREYRNSMVEELLRLRGLIEGILTLSRAEQGEGMLRRTSLEVDEVVRQSAARCRAQADAAGVKIETSLLGSGERLFGDLDLLSTMLDNLVRNAVRFSPPRGTVDIRVERDGRRVRVSVRDRGPGIPAEFIDKIFERFVQVPGANPHGRGTGLGLAIAKAVCEAHGGSIAVRNRRDRGSEFTVTLPLSA